MSQCDRFKLQVEHTLGPILDEMGVAFKHAREVDGCRLYYWSNEGEVCVYFSLRGGDVNCDVMDKTNASSQYYHQWVPIRTAVGYGVGLSESELIARMPEGFPSNEELLREIGPMLRQLRW
jgi:hypothetical protein